MTRQLSAYCFLLFFFFFFFFFCFFFSFSSLHIILDSGNIPSDWTRGIILPIYKNKGSKRDPANYRPITLLSCLGKLFTSILNKRLYKYLEENNLLSETQSGFRKEYSTIDNIFSLYALQEYCKREK